MKTLTMHAWEYFDQAKKEREAHIKEYGSTPEWVYRGKEDLVEKFYTDGLYKEIEVVKDNSTILRGVNEPYRTRKDGVGSVGRLTLKFGPGVGKCNVMTFKDKKPEVIKGLDLSLAEGRPWHSEATGKYGYGIYPGNKGFIVYVKHNPEKGRTYCRLPVYKKDDSWRDSLFLIDPAHSNDPAREGKGAKINSQVEVALAGAYEILVYGSLTEIKTEPKVFPGGRPAQTCLKCKNCFHWRSANGADAPRYARADDSISRKKDEGVEVFPSMFCRMLIEELREADDIWNNWRDSGDVHYLISGFESNAEGEKKVYQLDEHGRRIPIYRYRQIPVGRVRYHDYAVDWKGLKEKVAEDVAMTCPYYTFNAPKDDGLGTWMSATLKNVAAFTEVSVEGRPVTWVKGLPGEVNIKGAVYTGRVGVNSGTGVMIVLGHEWWDRTSGAVSSYVASKEINLDKYIDLIAGHIDANRSDGKEKLRSDLLAAIANFAPNVKGALANVIEKLL